MDKDTIDEMIQKLIHLIDDFREVPDIEKAQNIDKQTSILRFCIGEHNFLPLHYFRAAHEDAVKYIDEHDKTKESVQ